MCAGVGSVQEQGSANVLRGGHACKAGWKKGRQGVCRETGVQTGVEGGAGWGVRGGFIYPLVEAIFCNSIFRERIIMIEISGLCKKCIT